MKFYAILNVINMIMISAICGQKASQIKVTYDEADQSKINRCGLKGGDSSLKY